MVVSESSLRCLRLQPPCQCDYPTLSDDGYDDCIVRYSCIALAVTLRALRYEIYFHNKIKKQERLKYERFSRQFGKNRGKAV
jgi:hypothetical protein